MHFKKTISSRKVWQTYLEICIFCVMQYTWSNQWKVLWKCWENLWKLSWIKFILQLNCVVFPYNWLPGKLFLLQGELFTFWQKISMTDHFPRIHRSVLRTITIDLLQFWDAYDVIFEKIFLAEVRLIHA